MKTIIFAAVLCVAPAVLRAQVDFKVEGRPVQVHSFFSQGFGYSDNNNYLTMKTSSGSAAFTDGGANISMAVTDKFRIGAQVYDRNIGALGKWHPQLDWATADYRFKSWFGIRAGKVKTVLGLYNDTQDMEFLHTWAILPQSMYPLDLRASIIAHTGGDVYGTIGLKKLGDLSYTGYAGTVSYDPYGGYPYGLVAQGLSLTSMTNRQMGGDLRWNGLLRGLLLGVSYAHQPLVGNLATQVAPTVTFPVTIESNGNTASYYAEYKAGNLTLDGEYRREVDTGTEKIGPMPTSRYSLDQRGWYASAAYRVSKRLELGAYHSRFYPAWGKDPTPPTNHMFDTVAAARIDLLRQWDLKIEGHFMDGYGESYSFRGFYPQQNPGGLKPRMNMLVIRTGWNF
jgi:hypothetical protein